MTKHQVSAGKAAAAGGTLERFFVCVGAFVPLQVLQAGEPASANGTNMWSGLVCTDLEGLLWYRLCWARVQHCGPTVVFRGHRVGKHLRTGTATVQKWMLGKSKGEPVATSGKEKKNVETDENDESPQRGTFRQNASNFRILARYWTAFPSSKKTKSG